jgi:hypothetical protein
MNILSSLYIFIYDRKRAKKLHQGVSMDVLTEE